MVKRKGKGKKGNKKDTKKYEFRTLEQNNGVKVQFNTLLSSIGESINSLKDAVDGTYQALIEKDNIDDWNAFLSCDKIPKTHFPQLIRDYFFQRLYCNRENVENTYLWILNIDERSILSQDLNSIDCTRKKLELSKVNFGYQYDELVMEGLQVLKRIEETLVTRKGVETQSVYNDIHGLKIIGEKCIRSYIDEMTYRILSCENAYLIPISHVAEEYKFIANDFKCHIWAIQSVPIRFDHDLYPFIKIKYEATESSVILPQEVLYKSMVVRSLHLKYDHYSEYTRSYTMSEFLDDNDGFKLVLKKEWIKRVAIQLEVRNRMIEERESYEAYILQKEIEEAQRLKAAKNAKGNEKPPKKAKDKNKRWAVEPPKLTPDMWPIVDNDFIAVDDQDHISLLEKTNPINMTLDEGEINLRNYRILGGVYEYDFVIKPRNTILPKRVLTWHEKERILQYLDVPCKNIDKTEIIDPKSENYHLFTISIVLPENVCYFGSPQPCQWIGTILLEPSTTGLIIDPNWMDTLCIIEDIKLNDILSKDDVYNIVRHTIPKTISSYNFAAELQVSAPTEDKMKGLKKLMPKVSELSLGLEVLTHMKDNIIEKKTDVNAGDTNKNPERLHPIFEKTQPILFNARDDNPNEMYLSEFLEKLEDYKQSIQPKSLEKRREVIKQPIHSVVRASSTSKLSIDKGRNKLKIVSKRRKTRTIFEDEPIKAESGEIIAPMLKLPKWTTENILHHTYDPSTREVTIWTDRLGTFGFAFYSYIHFPYKFWMLQPDVEDQEKINLFIESKYAKFNISVTAEGYTALICDFSKLVKTRKTYLEITKPVYHLRDFIKECQANNLNIFPERDSSFYVTGRFSEKHFEAENHTYFCMTKYAKLMEFSRSEWNRLSHRRIMIFKCDEIDNRSEEPNVIQITPEEALFVDVKELCTVLSVIELQYIPTWRNIDFTPDLWSLITSSFPGSKPKQIREPKLITNLVNLLSAVRPLSFS